MVWLKRDRIISNYLSRRSKYTSFPIWLHYSKLAKYLSLDHLFAICENEHWEANSGKDGGWGSNSSFNSFNFDFVIMFLKQPWYMNLIDTETLKQPWQKSSFIFVIWDLFFFMSSINQIKSALGHLLLFLFQSRRSITYGNHNLSSRLLRLRPYRRAFTYRFPLHCHLPT